MVLEIFVSYLESFDTSFFNQIPRNIRILFTLLITTILLVMYIIFVWKFYRFLAKKDIIDMNLSQYNYSGHPVLSKISASLLFILEYLIIVPILVFFWFSVLALVLLLLSRTQEIATILLISSSIIAATRVVSYYSEKPAQELAKIFPLTFLAVFISDFTEFFVLDDWISRIGQIPTLFDQIIIYLIFIAALEIFLRSLYIVVDFFSSEEEREQEEKGETEVE